MDLEQIVKRLEWLDGERRKDKTTIATLEERLISLEGNITPLMQQIKEVSGDLSRITAILGRFDQIETSIAQMRVEFSRSLESIEKTRADHAREMEKVRRADQESITKSVSEVRKGLEPFTELKKDVQARKEEEYRLGRLIEEAEKKITENQRSDEEYRRMQRMLEEGRRQDAKRLTDLQGELSAVRKRVDEQRGKVDMTSDTVRKVELRITDLQNAEGERRQAQTAFIEKQNLMLLERERLWKEWQTQFDDIIGKAINLDTQLQALDATQRAVRRSQESFDDVTQRFDRRINEITEMQRLVEERFRQEWVTFKSDDQKRWANYSIAQDEMFREQTRQMEKHTERILQLEDGALEVRDILNQIVADSKKRLQDLLSISREWVEQMERNKGLPV